MPSPLVTLSPRVLGLRPSATVSINERSDALIAAGRTVYKLGLGQSPFPVPPGVVAALRDHATRKEYMPVRGFPPLREAVAAFHARRLGLVRPVHGDDVLIGPGSKELMFQAQLVFDGELLLPSPSWVSYAPQARILEREVSFLPTEPGARWLLRPHALHDHCARAPGKPRLLVLNYPSNPTGQTFSDGELAELAAVARAHRVIVISDEIYGELHHDGGHRSIAVHYPEGTIVSSGLSKWCGAGGWRLGTFLFPPELRELLAAMTAVASETYTTTSAPVQCAAVTAFACGPEIEDYLARARRILAGLGGWCRDALVAAGVGCDRPQGGFYLFPDLSPLAERLRARGVAGGEDLCERLLDQAGVAVLPGGDFGRPRGDWTVRLAYVDFSGQDALDRLARDPACATDDPATLRAIAPRVVAAIEHMVSWLG
ncbi:MAG: aminotransferase class I/II-fold pyridoxal phosphate-dependent enzyme [Myxococcales bacterium]|nr:aminotransferase class I/II-fold pyridoxal phosphate-dependent enzyme [Myxococcales bacterium]